MRIFTTLVIHINTKTSCSLGTLSCTSGIQEINDSIILLLPLNDLLPLLTRG